MYRRIRRPKEQEEYYTKLTDRAEFGIFASYKDVFMAAGMMGFIEKKKKPFTNSLDGINWNVFNMETDEVIINAVAISETGDYSLINTDDETFDRKMQIYEEYAAGGLEALYKKVMEEPKRALSIYVDLLMSLEAETTSKDRNLKHIADLLTF